jgi:DNA polymerase-1
MPVVRSRYWPSYDLDLRYLRLCAAMMDAGMAIDIPYINDWSGRISAWHEQAMTWLGREFGIVSPEAHAQVGEVLRSLGVEALRFTDKLGQVKCDKDSMDAYAASAPQAAEFIRTVQGAKKAYKIVHSYLAKFLEMAIDGVVHYSIHSVGAQRTSRSSVTDPPMHTYDRDIPVLRGSFVPREGNAFVAIDADQIEMRLAAIFSKDPQLIADFLRCDATGESFFVNLASRIYREAVSKRDPRYSRTKNTAYATIYGSGMNTAAVTAGVTRAELEPIYRGFKAMYATLDRRSRRLVRRMEGSRDPRVRTISGRELVVDKHRAYAAVDYEIQGSAADLMKAGGVAMDAAGLGQFLRCSVHDEWWLECPRDIAADVLAQAEQILTDRTSFPLPITWSGGIMDGRLVKM